ncbi:hypothetical protein EON63_05875 [archaeon]|nr:MAG: hypothetical protein EON63_05875 [archaeon]
MDHAAPVPSATYSVLHNVPDNEPGHDNASARDDIDLMDDENDDEIDLHAHHHHHKTQAKKEVLESFDFNDVESMMWLKVINANLLLTSYLLIPIY